MAISFVNESHSPGISGYESSVTIDVPSGVQEDDLLLAVVGGTRNAAPSGWTLLGSAAQGSSTGTVYVYWRLAGSSEPSSYTFTFTGVKYSKNHSIIAYRGVDTSNPIGNSDVRAVTDDEYDTNSITVTAGQWVCSFATHYTFATPNTVRTWTVNSGSERADYGGSLGTQEGSSTAWYDSNGSVSAGSTSRTHTASASTSVGTTGLLALNPGGTDHSVSPSETLTLTDSTSIEHDGPVIFTASYLVDIG